MKRMLALAIVLAGCGTSGSTAVDGGSFDCPDDPPAEGAPCAPGALCVYERCASDGVIAAQCLGADGGGGTFRVTTSACADTCSGSACVGGQVCAEQRGGALLTMCRAHTCGEGPLDCQCLCGEDRCEIYGSSGGEGGAIFACYLDCGADICP